MIQHLIRSAAILTLALAPLSAQTAKKAPAPASTSTAKKAPATAARKPAAATAASGLTTEDEKTIYALGLSVYRSLGQLDLTPAELEIVKRAMSDAAAGKPQVELSVYGPKIEGLAKVRTDRVAMRQKGSSTAFLMKAAAEPGAAKLPSGVIYKELRPGTGASPVAADQVKVNYRGTLVDGTEFDSSYRRNEPVSFALTGVIRCWTEGVQKMKVGGKARLVCPSDTAYGDQGRPGIPGGAALIFEIELLDIPKGK